MTQTIPEIRTLHSGTVASVLIVRPQKMSVAEGYRERPDNNETAVAQLLGEARLEMPLTPVPGPQTLLPQPETIDHPQLGRLDVFSERGKACLTTAGIKQAPLFLIRSKAATISTEALLINSNYFLFLEPDLDGPWNAYGDPIGLVKCGGVVDYPPQLPRACLCFSGPVGEVKRIGFEQTTITLANDDQVFPHPFGHPANTHSYNAFARCHGAIGTCSPPAERGYDLAYLGRYPLAGRRAGGLPIPRAGCVVRLPDRAMALELARQTLEYQLEGNWTDAIQAGPQLLRDGQLTDRIEDVFEKEHMTETSALPDSDTVSPARWCADWDTTRAARLGAGTDKGNKLVLAAIAGSSSLAGKGNNIQRRGATLRDLAMLLQAEGVINGLHLDGGGSTQVFGQAGGALISPADVHHTLIDRPAQYDRPVPTWISIDT